MEGTALVFAFPDSKWEGKVARTRMTVTLVTPSAWTVKNERSVEGGPWTVTGQGKCDKAK